MKKRLLTMKNRIYTIAVCSAAFIAATILTTSGVHAQSIATIAGTGVGNYTGDGGAATAATVNAPRGAFADGSGNIYFADGSNNVVRKISNTGVITTVAGNGTFGYTGNGGAATAATLAQPYAVTMDAAGNLYISDRFNYCVRKVNTAGIISTYAGTGVNGYTGDGGAATAARLSSLAGITLDGSGNLVIADANNSVVRKVNASTGIITTIAGTIYPGFMGDGGSAVSARLNSPTAVVYDASGNLYISDNLNNRIRRVTPSGTISTVIGTGTGAYSGDGGPCTVAEIYRPNGLWVDSVSGYLFFADDGNHVVRMVKPSGTISTVAGNNTGAFAGDGAAATAASVNNPYAVTMDNAGNLYISDRLNNRIRKVTPSPVVCAGTTTLCTGSNTTVTPSVTGGVFRSGNTGIATVDASTGVVTAVGAGTATITYTTGTDRGTLTVTVSSVPSAITGTTTLCQGSTTTLSSTTTGGGWISSDLAVATTTPGGVITGAGAGTATITYSIGGIGCYVTTIVSVSPLPDAGTITGTNNVCEANTVTLTNTATGGSWSSSNTSVATVSATGVVTGVVAGAATISYSASNSCGSANKTLPFTVNSCPTYVKGATASVSELTIYPNPAHSGNASFILTGPVTEQVTIVVTNVAGEKVTELTTTTNTTVELKLNQPSGIYFLSATTAHERYVSKIMVQ